MVRGNHDLHWLVEHFAKLNSEANTRMAISALESVGNSYLEVRNAMAYTVAHADKEEPDQPSKMTTTEWCWNKFCEKLADILPNRVIYWAFMKVVAHYCVRWQAHPSHARCEDAADNWAAYRLKGKI